MRYNLITIEGNIGAGKTSLARKLAADFDAQLILEQFADNPFLPKFYAEPEKFAFPLELFFMAERYQQLRVNLPARELFTRLTISDYMFTKSLIFAKVTLGKDEFKLYQRLFNIINPSLPDPELIVYLYATIERLQENIRQRGRAYEQSIPDEYLQKLQDTYFDYFRQSPRLRILVLDITRADFLSNHDTYLRILDLLERDYAPGMHTEIL